MLQPRHKRDNRDHRYFPKTRAGLLSWTLKMIRGLELHPDLLPNTSERLQQLRDDFRQAKAVCDAITEDQITREALDKLRHEARLAGYYPFLVDPQRDPDADAQYRQQMIVRCGFYECFGEVLMELPGGPGQFQVLDVGDLGLDWILFACEPPCAGGRVFGYKVQRRISPNAKWQTLGRTDECEFLFLDVAREVQHQYRIVAFNAAGETPGEDILTYTLTAKE
jgi:hypothetical protein